MLKIEGNVIGRMRGIYKTRDGEERTKILYTISDGLKQDVFTDFECRNDPLRIGTEVSIPVYVNIYMSGGQARCSYIRAYPEDNSYEAF